MRRPMTSAPILEILPVDRRRWPDLERLFESRGGPKACWCMVWRADAQERRHRDGASHKSQLRRRVMAGTPVGLLGYLECEPVAWCSVAPKETHRPLTDEDTGSDGVWSIVCFFVTRRLRSAGLSRRLLDAAIAHAQEQGARAVEAYPVDPHSPSYRFMGFVPLFTAAGFKAVGRAGTRRHVMRLALPPSRPATSATSTRARRR